MLDIRVFSEQRKNRAVVDNPSLRPCFSRCYLAAQDFSSFRVKRGKLTLKLVTEIGT